MKRTLVLLAALFFISQSFAAVTSTSSLPNASEILIPIRGTEKRISLKELSTISLADFQTLTGKKLNLPARISFRLAQIKLRQNINEDGTIKNKILARAYGKGFFDTYPFHAGGFALGFLIPVFGVLIAYLINDDLKEDRRFWAWRGFLAGLTVALIVLRAMAV